MVFRPAKGTEPAQYCKERADTERSWWCHQNTTMFLAQCPFFFFFFKLKCKHSWPRNTWNEMQAWRVYTPYWFITSLTSRLAPASVSHLLHDYIQFTPTSAGFLLPSYYWHRRDQQLISNFFFLKKKKHHADVTINRIIGLGTVRRSLYLCIRIRMTNQGITIRIDT